MPENNTTEQWGFSIPPVGFDMPIATSKPTLTQAVDMQTLTSRILARDFERENRRELERLMEELQQIDKPSTKKKSKSISDTLNEIATNNEETFKKIKSGFDILNDFRNKRIKELCIKYDTLLFNLIGKNYTLVDKEQVSIDKNIRHLTECINSHLVRHLNNNKDLDYFKESLVYYMTQRVLTVSIPLDKKRVKDIEVMSIDLYDYIIEYIRIKEENDKLTGKCDKVNTVCEDYLNNTRNDIRASLTTRPFGAQFNEEELEDGVSPF